MTGAIGARSRISSIVACRHQRFIGRLGVRHHQQRVAVGRRLRGLDGADHAAGAGAVLDHEGLAEVLLQDAADLARRDVGRAAGAERHDDLDRPRSDNLEQHIASQQASESREALPPAPAQTLSPSFQSPKPGLVLDRPVCRPTATAKSGTKSSQLRRDFQYSNQTSVAPCAHLANWFEREPCSYLTNCINQAAAIGATNEPPAMVTAK